MFGTRLLSSLALTVAALAVLTPATRAGDWFWYPHDLFHRPWDWPNGHWPSTYLYFTGSTYYGYYSVHYPMGGEDFYIVTPADIKWIRDPSRVLIEVRVPFPDATVIVDGQRMYREGIMRRFVSPRLQLGAKYLYEVQATWLDKNGIEQKETKQVKCSPGERLLVDFIKPNGLENGIFNGK
jgi:uncharacterized protein (TIGR03000 family)